jgi:hypothetical protein
MPILTIRMSDEEMEAASKAAERHHLNKSEFARRAINSACSSTSKTSSLRGALKGKYTYAQAMKMLRG